MRFRSASISLSAQSASCSLNPRFFRRSCGFALGEAMENTDDRLLERSLYLEKKWLVFRLFSWATSLLALTLFGFSIFILAFSELPWPWKLTAHMGTFGLSLALYMISVGLPPKFVLEYFIGEEPEPSDEEKAEQEKRERYQAEYESCSKHLTRPISWSISVNLLALMIIGFMWRDELLRMGELLVATVVVMAINLVLGYWALYKVGNYFRQTFRQSAEHEVSSG